MDSASIIKAPEVTPATARRFLKALSDGVAPQSQLTRWLTVGQEKLLAKFEEDLESTERGQFCNLLLLGNPGVGKSQLLITLQYLAIEGGFVTAYFSQDIQSRLAFNRPDLVYQRIIETMRLPQDPDRTFDPLRKILDDWVDVCLPKLRGTNRSMTIAYKLGEISLLPSNVVGIPTRTRLALVGYIMATEQQNEEAKIQFLNVIRGPGLTNTCLLETAQSVRLHRKGFMGYTPSAYDSVYYFGQIKTLIFILRVLGYRGMVTLFDEVTAIIDLGSRSRKKAYEVLDSLFFNEHKCEGLYAVFAYMPAFINQLRADRSYVDEDYVQRWSTFWDQQMREIESLDGNQLDELLRRLAYLHSIARSWPAWSIVANDAKALIKEHQREGLPIRDLVRKGLDLLDQRNIKYQASSHFKGMAL